MTICSQRKMKRHIVKQKPANGKKTFFLSRISHKDRCERPESAVNGGYSVKKSADILKYFEDAFWSCNPAGMVLSGLAADRL
jgi:hypothetical protein